MNTEAAEPSTDLTAHVDPEITEMVDHVRNRYGAHGLRQLIELASREADVTESALAELADAT